MNQNIYQRLQNSALQSIWFMQCFKTALIRCQHVSMMQFHMKATFQDSLKKQTQ